MGRVRKKHLFLHAPYNIIATLLLLINIQAHFAHENAHHAG